MKKLKAQIKPVELFGKVNISLSSANGRLQAKTVYPSEERQEVLPTDNHFALSAVYVEAAPLQEITLNPSELMQNAAPDADHYGIGAVTVNPATLQEKTVTPGDVAQEITADEGYYGMKKVVVEAVTGGGGGEVMLQDLTVTPTDEVQTFYPDEGFDGFSSVTVEAVESSGGSGDSGEGGSGSGGDSGDDSGGGSGSGDSGSGDDEEVIDSIYGIIKNPKFVDAKAATKVRFGNVIEPKSNITLKGLRFQVSTSGANISLARLNEETGSWEAMGSGTANDSTATSLTNNVWVETTTFAGKVLEAGTKYMVCLDRYFGYCVSSACTFNPDISFVSGISAPSNSNFEYIEGICYSVDIIIDK